MAKLTVLLLGLLAIAANAKPGDAGNKKAAKPPKGKPPKPTAVKGSKSFDYVGDYVGVKVDGNNAKFSIFNTEKAEKNAKLYHVSFQSFFQASTNVPPFTELKKMNLNGNYDWTISDFVETSNSGTWETAFNMTSVAAPGTPAKPHPWIQFRNHILQDENGASIKFDFVVDGWDSSWWDASATHLILQYKIASQAKGGVEVKPADGVIGAVVRGSKSRPKLPSIGGTGTETVTEDIVSFEGADFSALPSFGTRNGTKTVKVAMVSDILYLAYEKFDTYMLHDPAVSLNGDSSENYIVFSAAPAQAPAAGVIAAVLAAVAYALH